MGVKFWSSLAGHCDYAVVLPLSEVGDLAILKGVFDGGIEAAFVARGPEAAGSVVLFGG